MTRRLRLRINKPTSLISLVLCISLLGGCIWHHTSVTPTLADVVQWQNSSFPSWLRGFESRHRLHRHGRCKSNRTKLTGSWAPETK